MFNSAKTLRIVLLGIVFVSISLLIWNADIAIRAIQSVKEGTFTAERLRLDIASLNIGRTATVVPIDSRVSPLDGMVQVYVPAGEFVMGDDGEFDVDSPMHLVYLDAFWVDKVEVTNAMYEKCVREKGCTLPVISADPYYGNWVYRDHPIVYVNWFQANEYCEWAGRKLPTEAEWEKAARGTDSRKYPWGNEHPNPRLANFAESLIDESLPVYRYPIGASPYGALNMAGNVREWVADWFDAYYYLVSPHMNPTGPKEGTERSLRSGDFDATANLIKTTSRYRHEPQSAGLTRGFRCAESGNAASP